MLKLWFQPGYINLPPPPSPPLSSLSACPPHPSTLRRREISSSHLRCCQRELQRVLEETQARSPPPPTGSPGEERWEQQEEVTWCFFFSSLHFQINLSQERRSDKSARVYSWKSADERGGDVLNDSDGGGPGSGPLGPFSTQAGCHNLLSVWFRWLFCFSLTRIHACSFITHCLLSPCGAPGVIYWERNGNK